MVHRKKEKAPQVSGTKVEERFKVLFVEREYMDPGAFLVNAD